MVDRDRIDLILRNDDRLRMLVNKELDKVKPKSYKKEIITTLIVGIGIGFFVGGLDIEYVELLQEFTYGNF